MSDKDFVLTLWTNQPDLARAADAAGVQRIGLDLERIGKAQRQRGRGTWVSTHEIDQLDGVRSALCHAQLFARTNPLHADSRAEVDQLVGLGVQVLMLPMFDSARDVERFTDIVAQRATVVPLLETRASAEQISDIVAVEGIEEVHVGVNDLALSLGTRMRFEVLSSPLLEHVATCVRGSKLRLGIGAVGLIGDESVPIHPDLLYARYVQLGASAALVARSFLHKLTGLGGLTTAVAQTRARLAWWRAASAEDHARAAGALHEAVSRCQSW